MRAHVPAVLLSILGVALGAAPCGAASSRYLDATYGFSVRPPAFAPSAETPVTVVAIFNAPPEGGFAANLNVQVQRPGLSLADFKKLSEQQFGAVGMKLLSSRDLQAEGLPAVEWVAEGDVQGHALKFRIRAVPHGDAILLLTCSALAETFDRYDAAFKESLDSLALPK